MEDLKKLPTSILNTIYNSKSEIVVILNDNTIIETDDDNDVEKYEAVENLNFIFFTSDFETMYAVRDELKARKQ